MKKRILSTLLALTLCLGLVPVLGLPAQAAEGEYFQYTAPDGVIYNYGRNILDKVATVCLAVVGIEDGSTDITIPEVLEGVYTNKAGEEVPFSMEVTGITYGAFHNCDSLETATIQGCPILDGGFYQCASLRELDLSECTATTIDRSTFAYDCPSLETVTLPAGLTRINSTAFGQCKNLRDVYFLGSTAPTVPSSTLHNSFNNAAIFHVPSGASGYNWTGKEDYRHVVDYGNKDSVPYGMHFEMDVDASGRDATVKGNRVDLGSGIQMDSVDSQKKAVVTITNTGSDTFNLSVSNSNVNVFTYSSSHVNHTGLFPGERATVEITLHGGSNYEAGTHTGTVELTLEGQITGETVTEEVELTYTVDGGNGLEISPTVIDFGDIPANTVFEDMPTATVTVTSHLAQKGYLRLHSTDLQTYNRVYVQYVTGDDQTSISNGESVTFTIQLTPMALLDLRNGEETYAFTLYEKPWSTNGSNKQLANGSITLKANPIHASGLSLSSSTLDLGKTESVYYSANRFLNTSVTLTNTGTQDVVLTPSSLSNFVVAGAFSATGSYTLKAGESVPVTLAPKDGLKPGTYEETLTIRGGENSVKLRVQFTVQGEQKEAMELSSSYLDFGRLAEGYERPAAQTVTIENTGTEAITLTQPTAQNYDVGRLTRTTLDAGQSASFTLRPKAGLKANGTAAQSYTETVTLRTAKGLSESVEVYFTVTPEGGAPVVFDPNDAPTDWAQAEVAQAITDNLVPQSLQSRYAQNITRAEFCALATQVYETVTGETITGRVTFSDTSDVNVQKMAYLGVVKGTGDDKFSPNDTLTREQAATMLDRLASAMGQPLPKADLTFTDKDSIGSWAQEAVGRIANARVMNGTGNNLFSPQMSYTREQSVVTIVRMYELLKQ